MGPLKIPPHTKTERILDKGTGQEAILQTFVRADGSMAERSAFTTNIWNLAERTETVLDHLTRTYVVAPLPARRIPQYLQRDPDCASYFKGKLEARVTCSELAGVTETVFLKVGEPDETEFHIASDYRRIANFVDFARVTKGARGAALSEAEIQLQTRKWSNVVAEARAEGDNRFQ